MTQHNLKQPDKKPVINKDDLHPKELELIRLIREKYRFGKIVIVVHDGLPVRIEQTVEYQGL